VRKFLFDIKIYLLIQDKLHLSNFLIFLDQNYFLVYGNIE